ncbi:hypothetical protein G7046_g8139 [Stylonectria norvegica]|nr:hypothetical protein G7046_g8139 [Stylonectria norvegica]
MIHMITASFAPVLQKCDIPELLVDARAAKARPGLIEATGTSKGRDRPDDLARPLQVVSTKPDQVAWRKRIQGPVSSWHLAVQHIVLGSSLTAFAGRPRGHRNQHEMMDGSFSFSQCRRYRNTAAESCRSLERLRIEKRIKKTNMVVKSSCYQAIQPERLALSSATYAVWRRTPCTSIEPRTDDLPGFRTAGSVSPSLALIPVNILDDGSFLSPLNPATRLTDRSLQVTRYPTSFCSQRTTCDSPSPSPGLGVWSFTEGCTVYSAEYGYVLRNTVKRDGQRLRTHRRRSPPAALDETPRLDLESRQYYPTDAETAPPTCPCCHGASNVAVTRFRSILDIQAPGGPPAGLYSRKRVAHSPPPSSTLLFCHGSKRSLSSLSTVQQVPSDPVRPPSSGDGRALQMHIPRGRRQTGQQQALTLTVANMDDEGCLHALAWPISSNVAKRGPALFMSHATEMPGSNPGVSPWLLLDSRPRTERGGALKPVRRSLVRLVEPAGARFTPLLDASHGPCRPEKPASDGRPKQSVYLPGTSPTQSPICHGSLVLLDRWALDDGPWMMGHGPRRLDLVRPALAKPPCQPGSVFLSAPVWCSGVLDAPLPMSCSESWSRSPHRLVLLGRRFALLSGYCFGSCHRPFQSWV